MLHEEERDGHDHVGAHTAAPLRASCSRRPVRSAITSNVDMATAATSKVLNTKSIGCPIEERDEHQGRSHEQRDLRARPDRDLERHVELVPQREHHRRGMLCRVADDRDHDQSDEQLGQAQRLASAGSSEPTRNSDINATSAVAPSSERDGPVLSSTPPPRPSSGVWNRCSWVISVNGSAASVERDEHGGHRAAHHLALQERLAGPPGRTSAGISRPVTASASEVACTEAGAAR